MAEEQISQASEFGPFHATPKCGITSERLATLTAQFGGDENIPLNLIDVVEYRFAIETHSQNLA
jgi:hypothetical protein